jgi:hypothetical protein
VNLLAPNTIYGQYFKVLDMRFSKIMTMGRTRITALVEGENLLNLRSISAVTLNYGSNWLRPWAGGGGWLGPDDRVGAQVGRVAASAATPPARRPVGGARLCGHGAEGARQALPQDGVGMGPREMQDDPADRTHDLHADGDERLPKPWDLRPTGAPSGRRAAAALARGRTRPRSG